MSFAALAVTGPPRRKGPSCTVGAFIESLEPAERDGLTALLRPGSGWLSSAIATEIAATGTRIAGTTIARHRRRDCCCELR